MRIGLLILILLSPLNGAAVENDGILSKFKLVGVIAEAQKNKTDSGIVVIKDVASSRSFMLRSGQSLPNMRRWKIQDISRGGIVVSNGEVRVSLTHYSFQGPAKTDKSEPNTELANDENDWPPEEYYENSLEAESFKEAIDQYLEDLGEARSAPEGQGLNRQIRSFDDLLEYKRAAKSSIRVSRPTRSGASKTVTEAASSSTESPTTQQFSSFYYP